MRHPVALVFLSVCLAGLLSAVHAQTFTASPLVTVDAIIASSDLLGPVRVSVDPPIEALLFRGRGMVASGVFVARVHPTRSGLMGIDPTPGLCVEAARFFTVPVDTLTIADVNNDKLDDVVGRKGATVQVLYGMGLSACR